jgi:hypothetical protein
MTMAKRKAAKLKKLNTKAKALVIEHEKALDQGKSKYKEADAKLGELIGLLEVGVAYPLPDGRTLTIVDQFDKPDANPKVYKPAGVSRYRADIAHA